MNPRDRAGNEEEEEEKKLSGMPAPKDCVKSLNLFSQKTLTQQLAQIPPYE